MNGTQSQLNRTQNLEVNNSRTQAQSKIQSYPVTQATNDYLNYLISTTDNKNRQKRQLNQTQNLNNVHKRSQS